MIRAILLALTLCATIAVPTRAQDQATAVWQVTNFDVTVNSMDAERALNGRVVLSVRNVGRGSSSTFSVRINPKAEIKNVTAGGATAGYRSLPETRGNAQRVTITLPKAIAPDETFSATIDYRFPVEEN